MFLLTLLLLLGGVVSRGPAAAAVAAAVAADGDDQHGDADGAAVLPWAHMASIRALSYLPTTNPLTTELASCGIALEDTDWTEVVGGTSRTFQVELQDSEAPCTDKFKSFKARTSRIDWPEKGYDAAVVECVHLFMLESDSASIDSSSSSSSSSGIPPFFPRAYYLLPAHALSKASVCLTEYVEGVDLVVHVSTIREQEEYRRIVRDMLGILRALRSSSIIHRDVRAANFIVTTPTELGEAAVGNVEERHHRLILVDFTWAMSPLVAPMFPPPRVLNGGYAHPHGPSDVYSAGLVLQTMLTVFARLDTRWLAPVVSAMVDERMVEEDDRWIPRQWSTDELDALLEQLESLQPPTGAGAGGAIAGRGVGNEVRSALCRQPNMYAPGAQFERFETPDGLPFVEFHGYQAFQVAQRRLVLNEETAGSAGAGEDVTEGHAFEFGLKAMSEGIQTKSALIDPILKKHVRGLSLLDIGGNHGYFCFSALRYGAREATLLDMDPTYTTNVEAAISHLGEPLTGRLHVDNRKLEELEHGADVVVALALVHWIFNCSEGSGSLAQAIGKLAAKARKALFIEWIDPTDSAIQTFAHTEGWERGDSPYTYAEFVRVLQSIFPSVIDLGAVTPTRRVLLAVHGGRYFLNDGAETIDQNNYSEWFIQLQ